MTVSYTSLKAVPVVSVFREPQEIIWAINLASKMFVKPFLKHPQWWRPKSLIRQARLVLCYLAPEKYFRHLMPNLKGHGSPASDGPCCEVWPGNHVALLGCLPLWSYLETLGLVLYPWSGLLRLWGKISLSLLNFAFLFTGINSSLFWPFWIILLCFSCLLSLANIICIVPIPALKI